METERFCHVTYRERKTGNSQSRSTLPLIWFFFLQGTDPSRLSLPRDMYHPISKRMTAPPLSSQCWPLSIITACFPVLSLEEPYLREKAAEAASPGSGNE